MTRLTTNAYAGSFHTLLRLNPELWSIDTTRGRLVLKFFVIVDFADSQRKGIMLALKMLHESQCPSAPWTRQLEDAYMQHLKGCEFHYKQSVKNTSNNGNVVPYHKQNDFKAGCHSMLTAQTMADFE
jgi:hypothetical protein